MKDDMAPWRAEDEDEAALWVARHLSNAVDATGFEQWLAGAPGRRELFDTLWAACMDDAVTDALRDREAEALSAPPVTHRPTRRGVAAASIAIAIGLTAGAVWMQRHDAPMTERTYSTGTGEVSRVVLADGSELVLNGNSRVRASIGDRRREVRLEAGEALFDVQHDPERPFHVLTDGAEVTVLGTRFDLALNDASVDLEVERGLVRFADASGGHDAVLVPAMHRATFAAGAIAAPARLARSAASDWRDGWLQASDMRLADIVPRLQRWTGKTIMVRDPALLQTRAAGRFRLNDPAAVLGSLGDLHGFSVIETADAFVIERK